MEFVDACKAIQEMCAAHNNCDDCAIEGYHCQAPGEECSKEMEPRLVQWRKEHPNVSAEGEKNISKMTDQSNINEFERWKDLQSEVVSGYNALSEDYWRTRDLIVTLRVIGLIALAIAAIVWIAYIFVNHTALMVAGIACNIWWAGFTIIANDIELSTLRQWRIAMIKYVGWNLTDD